MRTVPLSYKLFLKKSRKYCKTFKRVNKNENDEEVRVILQS